MPRGPGPLVAGVLQHPWVPSHTQASSMRRAQRGGGKHEKNIARHAEQRAHGLWHVIVADCPSFLGRSCTVHQHRSTDSSLMPVISPVGSLGQIAGPGYDKCSLHVSPVGHSLGAACSFLEFEVIYKAAKLSDRSVCCAPCTYRSAQRGNLKGLTTLRGSQHTPAQHRHERDGPTCFQRHSTRTMEEHGSPGTIIASHGPGEQPRDSLWQTRWDEQCRAGTRCRLRWKPDPPHPCRGDLWGGWAHQWCPPLNFARFITLPTYN